VGYAAFSAGCKERGMIHSADIREWRSRDVIEPQTYKIGAVEAVYL
jgi:hypothetical protein